MPFSSFSSDTFAPPLVTVSVYLFSPAFVTVCLSPSFSASVLIYLFPALSKFLPSTFSYVLASPYLCSPVSLKFVSLNLILPILRSFKVALLNAAGSFSVSSAPFFKFIFSILLSLFKINSLPS